jgi:hypothetical protein
MPAGSTSQTEREYEARSPEDICPPGSSGYGNVSCRPSGHDKNGSGGDGGDGKNGGGGDFFDNMASILAGLGGGGLIVPPQAEQTVQYVPGTTGSMKWLGLLILALAVGALGWWYYKKQKGSK